MVWCGKAVQMKGLCFAEQALILMWQQSMADALYLLFCCHLIKLSITKLTKPCSAKVQSTKPHQSNVAEITADLRDLW